MIFLTPLLTFLRDPVGRYVALAVFLSLGYAGWRAKIRHDVRIELEEKARLDEARRLKNATDAGNSVDVSPDRLRDNDGFRRQD